VQGATTTVVTINNSDFKGATLGTDYTATDTLIVALVQPTSFTGVRIRPYVTTTGTPVFGSASTIGAFLAGKENPVFVGKGTFDFGGTRWVIKFKDDKTYYGLVSGGTESVNDHWPTYSPSTSAGGWDTTDSRFLEINDVTGAYIYNSGASVWADTDATKKWWVAYSWYDGTSQTVLSPISGIEMKKRRFLQVTVPDIPKAGANTPDRARVWMQQAAATPTLMTGGLWDVRGTITYPQKTIYADFITSVPADTPVASNTFTTDGVEAVIRTSDNNSFWKGDNTAQFYKLVLASNQNATANQNNTPPLRVGDPADRHLRIGDNGIYSMLNNVSTPGRASMNMWAADFDFDMGGDGHIQFQTAGNIVARIQGQSSGADTALVLRNNSLVAGVQGFNSATASNANTVDMYALQFVGFSGFLDDSLAGGGVTTAGVNNAGRITRATNGSYTTSSIKFKRDVQPLSLNEAKGVLDMQAVSFFDTRDEGDIRVAGFIAEQAADLGTVDLWVGYDENTPAGIRYDKISAAHNVLIKELYKEIETLKRRLDKIG
jgi:hypothetical protein